jgi:hypothetical protein
VGQVSTAADSLVAAVPVVNHVVPAGTVSTVTAPVVQVADSTAATVVDTIVPPVTQAAPVLEPILEPVSDLVTGSVPLLVQLPDVPAGADPEILPVVDVVAPAAASSADQADAEPTARVNETPVVADTGTQHDSTSRVTPPSAGTVAAAAGLAGTSFRDVRAAAGAAEDAAAETTDPSEPAPVTALAPAAPGSASGGGSQSSGAAGSAAWLSSDSFEHFLQGVLLPWGFSAHTPSPVSFDPGSSPD